LIKAILRFIAVILLVAFVIALPLSLVLRDVGSLLFNPETTKALVRQNLSRSELMASLARQATEQMLAAEDPDGGEESAVSVALGQLTEEQWRQITDLVAPESLVQETADQVVDAFSAWLNTEAAFPEVQINLATLKQNAISNAGEVVGVVMSSLPACDDEDIASLSLNADLEQASVSIPVCLPPEPVYSLVISQAEVAMSGLLERAPDTIDLGQLNQGQAPAELTQLKQNLVSMRTFLNWSWAGVVAIGVIAAIMAASGTPSLLRWAGWPLILAGIITLVFGIGLRVFSLNFLDQFLAAVLEQGPGAMGSLGTAIASGALNLITGPLLIQGLVITALGIGSVIYARILAQRLASPGIPINRRRIGL
jgi:hypothetical protein